MAGFGSLISLELKTLQEKVKHLEVCDIPLNVGESVVIGEGSSAVVFRHVHEGKVGAVKKFKIMLSTKTVMKAANSLLKLKHVNVCSFRGFSLRPSAIIFEYCHVNFGEVNGIVHNLKELVTIFNDNGYFKLSERKDYCLQTCRGIAYLHSLGYCP